MHDFGTQIHKWWLCQNSDISNTQMFDVMNIHDMDSVS